MEILNVSHRKEEVYELLKQLRNDLSFPDFKMIFENAHRNDSYNFFGVQNEQQKLIGLIGFRILYDFLHLKHLYIDDLIIVPNARSQGIGKKLLEFAEQFARDNNCCIIRVSTGYDYMAGRNFYEKIGWDLKAVTYKRHV